MSERLKEVRLLYRRRWSDQVEVKQSGWYRMIGALYSLRVGLEEKRGVGEQERTTDIPLVDLTSTVMC